MAWQERELKFVLDDVRAAELAGCPELTAQVFDPARPIAYTRTTYLDTSALALTRAEGPVRRRLRVREYAAAPDLTTAPTLTGDRFLELKASSGGQRSKVRVRLTADGLARLFAGDAALGELCRPVDLAIDDALAAERVRPQMTTWYRRTSLAAPGVRVTLDHGVAFCAPVPPGEPAAPADELARWSGTVLEIKLAGELPGWLAARLEGVEACEGLSKLESGMQALAARAARAA